MKSSRDKSWRLVHDGKQVRFLDETSGITETKYTLFEAATEDECEAEISRLNLTPIPKVGQNV